MSDEVDVNGTGPGDEAPRSFTATLGNVGGAAADLTMEHVLGAWATIDPADGTIPERAPPTTAYPGAYVPPQRPGCGTCRARETVLHEVRARLRTPEGEGLTNHCTRLMHRLGTAERRVYELEAQEYGEG